MGHTALLRYGIIPESCLPYISGATHAPTGEPMGSAYCRQSAIATCTGRRFFARHPNPYEVQSAPLTLNGVPSDATQWLSGERAIKIAIISYGAVVSTMRVYSDFLGYLTGVYQRRSADFQGRTAVQLIGWGVEPSSGAPYWLAESNWGQKWGESQYFKACSVRDCWGEFCPPDNLNPTCSDSAAWADTQGYNCAWYTKNDPGCTLYVDQGQRSNCAQSCKTCPPLPLPAGEICGFFRIQRGNNHCGIEEPAAHTFAQVYSSSTEFGSSSPAGCADKPAWNDGYGRGCDWYAARQCRSLPDVGQLFNCPVTCGTCSVPSRVQGAYKGWRQRTSNSARRLLQAGLITTLLPLVTL